MTVGIRRPEAAVEIVLEGHADQACNRIGELFGKVLVACRLSEARTGRQECQSEKETTKIHLCPFPAQHNRLDRQGFAPNFWLTVRLQSRAGSWRQHKLPTSLSMNL